MKGDVGILGSVLIDFRWSEVAHGLLVFATWTDQFVDVDGFVVEIDFGQVVHVVSEFGMKDIMRNHRVEHFAFHLDAIVGEHHDVVLQILSDFQNRLVSIDFFEFFQDSECFLPLSRDRNVVCLIFLHGKAQSHQFGTHGIGGSGFRI